MPVLGPPFGRLVLSLGEARHHAVKKLRLDYGMMGPGGRHQTGIRRVSEDLTQLQSSPIAGECPLGLDAEHGCPAETCSVSRVIDS